MAVAEKTIVERTPRKPERELAFTSLLGGLYVLLGLWIVFVLVTSGPIASPKYRLPLEPPLMVLAGAGLCLLHRRWRGN